MRANHYQSFYGITCFGESHGVAIGVVLEDVKPGIPFPLAEIQIELDKRRPGKGKHSTPRDEPDKLEVISGLLDGITTGMPICLLVYNKDARSKDYYHLKEIFRPGHADYSWYHKFKIFDHRGGGRASGRETISRVAAGSAVEGVLGKIKIEAYPVKIGNFIATNFDAEPNQLFWPDQSNLSELNEYLYKQRKDGNSVGGIVEIKISNLPLGLGDPVFEKLDGNLAKALVSIGSVKGIEFGNGFALANLDGKSANDELTSKGWQSNNSGGILGGISNGNDIIMRIVVKPTPSINIRQKTIDKSGSDHEFKSGGRHDTIIIPRILPVAKAMVKLVLADAISHQKLISYEDLNLNDYREAFDKVDEDILLALHRRQKLSTQIGEWKRENSLQIENKSREQELLSTLKEKAEILEVDPDLVDNVWKLIIRESKLKQ